MRIWRPEVVQDVEERETMMKCGMRGWERGIPRTATADSSNRGAHIMRSKS
jgi:hypothetical protein